MKCPRCKRKMTRRKSKFGNKHWWGCTGWPSCTVTAAEHPDGTLMSTPADYRTKTMRIQAHELCGKIWGEWQTISKEKKQEMYDWLKANTRTGHIGKLHYNELEKLIPKLNKLLDKK